MTFRNRLSSVARKIRASRFVKMLPLYSYRTVGRVAEQAVELAKQRRSLIRQSYIDAVDQIVDQPHPYSLLKNYANRHPFLRIVHGAIIREVIHNRWDVKERFAKKCTVCGQEFKQLIEECPDCGAQALLRDPNPQEKKRLDLFLKDPNRDDEMVDIVKSVMKDNLSLDDWYVSVVEVATRQYAMYVEDASEMFICADKNGRLGNDVWFCPKCWNAEKNEKTYSTKGKCPECDGLLKETAYVQKHEGTIKARFGRDEIIHGNSDPWLPQLYGNSKVMAVLLELRTSLALDSRNLDIYTKGVMDKIVGLKGELQEVADQIAADVKEQREKVTIDSYTGRVGRESSGSLFIGTKEGVEVHDLIPDAQKMQSLDWMDFWFVKIVGGIYGVQPIMMNAPVRGPGGYFQRMQLIVQNDVTEEYQRSFEDPFNEQFVRGILGIRDWEFKFNEIEARNELEQAQIWQSKIAAGTAAVEVGLKAELTDEGELKISGEFQKPEMPSKATAYIMPKPPKVPEPKMSQPFSQEKMRKGKAWIVREVDMELAKAEDECTAEGGHWVTIRGTHVCIRQGETPEQAFKRTTGKELEPEGKEPKDIKAPNDKVVSGEPKTMTALELKQQIQAQESRLRKFFSGGIEDVSVEQEDKSRVRITFWKDTEKEDEYAHVFVDTYGRTPDIPPHLPYNVRVGLRKVLDDIFPTEK